MTIRRHHWAFVASALALAVGWQRAWSWHPQASIQLAIGIVAAILILWITEAAPLGVTALAIPMVATLTGLLDWKSALAVWGDPIIFLFLGTFLLARALDKHGVLDRWAQGAWSRSIGNAKGLTLSLAVMIAAGAVSTVQNNTAVTAMFLPVVLRLARKQSHPAWPLLALAYGATFGGMATPVGTAPNFIGYRAMKELDAGINFVSWLRVGLPVWLGTSVLAWAVLAVAHKLIPARSRWLIIADPLLDGPSSKRVGQTGGERAADYAAEARLSDDPDSVPSSSETEPWLDSAALADVGPNRDPYPEAPPIRHVAGLWAQGAFGVTVLLWLASGLIIGFANPSSPWALAVKTYLPEALIPLATAWFLFLVRVGPRGATVLNRRDFQAIDWDTLFLIAGGLCLGQILDASGTDEFLATTVTGVNLPPWFLMFLLAGTTVILSELTSNTATASLMVPIAASLAAPLGVSPVRAIWLVALSASLGFALPVSTPPNALVYGTRKVPLILMVVCGLFVDLACTAWVVFCLIQFA